MRPWIFVVVLALVVAGVGSTVMVRSEASDRDLEWSATASYLDACSCAPACPCLFGSAPTLGFCEGITLVSLEEAHFGGVNLDGVNVLAAYRGGKWIKFYVDDSATPEQAEAATTLLPTMEGFFAIDNVVEVKQVPIEVERGEGTIKVSTPNTVAHIEMMKGLNGEPIKIMNLPAPSFPGPEFHDHTQYKTILLKHDGGEQSYEHTGSTAFTANIDVKPEH